MSDAEEDRDSKVLEGDFLYQLRKIGPEASCPKVPSVMRLSMGLTRIGRGQHNDYFLDSLILKNFISRSHVEILGKKNENGETEFVLTDKGLNGTFINDCRSQKTCVLELGDKITFGHTNGYKIEPGSFAEQPKSEFQYIFEKLPVGSKTAEVCEEGLSPEPVEDHSVDVKKENDRLFLGDILSNKQTQDKPVKTKSQKPRNRKDSGSQSDGELSDVKNNSVPKGSKKLGKGNSDQQSKSSPVKESSSASRKSSTVSSVGLSETLPAVDTEDKRVTSDDEEKEEEIQKKKKVPAKRKSGSSNQKSGSKGKKAAPPPPVPSDSEVSSSDNEESHKPEADQKPPTQIKNRPKPARKRAPQADNAPAIGSRKRRRRSGKGSASASNQSAQDDPNLEPGVEWYEDDTCSSADCKRPKKKKTSWVQCDDCDNWYHTVCVGANYNLLKDSDAHFNCGCA